MYLSIFTVTLLCIFIYFHSYTLCIFIFSQLHSMNCIFIFSPLHSMHFHSYIVCIFIFPKLHCIYIFIFSQFSQIPTSLVIKTHNTHFHYPLVPLDANIQP
uniref:Uncharacterized protein n=1 Tax=Cacopsylla melanoneura TaxID=428564 RepID=A0A8D9BV27_9HEMI